MPIWLIVLGAIVVTIPLIIVSRVLVLAYLNRETLVMDDHLRARGLGKYVRLSDGVTHYQVAGPEDGEVLVFMTGATLSIWVWQGLFEKLAEAGFRVIRYDYYGRGYSDHPKIKYTMEVFHRQLTELLEFLKVDGPVTLVPLAFGGPIASEYALRRPANVNKIVFLAPDGFGVPFSMTMKLSLKPLIGPPIFHAYGTKGLAARLVEYTSDQKMIERLRKHYLPELAFKGFKHAVASSLRYVSVHNAVPIYSRINDQSSVRLQVIWGTEDRVTAIPSQDFIKQLFSRAEIHFLPGIGHLPHWERLDEVASAMIAFLRPAVPQDLKAGAR
ncbi:alpha/beta fold hydrolase [Bradyrhizobium japonicum]|uniref:alpha/beta fold hydrolase n=1 Tax=Bradyrhizobium japonicum TaxID=375 RepID=UPI0004B4F5E2|nr:alpha/beta hydrolase [Bradyrhizobium japonicum]